MRLLRPFVRAETYRSLVFLLAALPLAAVVLALLIAGWTTTLVLAITPLVIFVLVGFRACVGLVARVDAALRAGLLGVEAEPPISSGGRSGSGGAGRPCSSTAASGGSRPTSCCA